MATAATSASDANPREFDRAPTAHDPLRPLANDRLEIRHDPRKGRGVYARAAIGAGILIEAAPVILVPADQRKLLDSTILHDYYFVWDDAAAAEVRVAVALGLVSLCNHSRRPSARVRRNHARETLDLLAFSPIAAGREITIDYNCPLWFAAAD